MVAVVLATLCLAAVVADSFTATRAAAQDQAGQVVLTLSVPRDAPLSPGRLAPVEVTVTSERAARGVVTISTGGFGGPAPTLYQVPVELAASTPVEFSVAIQLTFPGIELSAELVVDGEVVADANLQRFADQDSGMLIALLGIEGPAAVPLPIGGGTAGSYEVTAERLETVGLPATSYLVASAAALRSMTADAVLAIVTWVADGGELMVVGDAGSVDEVFPSAWRGGEVPGFGTVRYVDDEWPELLLPPAIANTVGGDGGMLLGDIPGSPIEDLASDAGFRLPSLRSLLILLLVYSLIAGPITFVVLKHKSSTNSAWIVLPVLAAVCTVAALVVGADLRSDRGNVHATVVEVWPSGSKAASTFLVSSSRSTDRTIDAPQGWQYTGTGEIFGWGFSSTRTRVEPGRSGLAVTANLTAGGAASMQMSGPAPQFDGALIVESIVMDGASIAATVTNNSGADLTEVVALFGTAATEVGELADGESVAFTIEHSRSVRPRLAEFRLWDQDNFGNSRRNDNDVSQGVWAQWRSVEGLNAFPDGFVSVVGWTRDLDPPASSIGSGRTALIARAALPSVSQDGSPIPSVVVADLSDGNTFVNDGFFFGLRFTMRIDAAGLDASQVVIEVDNRVAGLEMWTGIEWIPVTLPGNGAASIGILDAALIGGQVHVRATVLEDWPVNPGISAVVGSAEIPETRPKGDVLSRFDEVRAVDPGFQEFSELAESFAIDVASGESEVFHGDLFGPEYDEYSIELNEADLISIELSANHDSLLRVRGPDGSYVAENDDSGGSLDSALVLTADSTGTYVIEARSLTNDGVGQYELQIDRESVEYPTTTEAAR
ncbi:MAG: hypothetical protein GY708_26805 [Actinomycetia bacterium]|nr:hypothetical protein [Actinomycetes bacterium]MCP4961356.1 hypothetical protein [Actinomycetes bacterium]